MILAHELAHIRRHDYLVNMIQSVVESLLFFHPAVWWISNRIRLEREYSCDDVAVGACRDVLSYARALSSLDALRDEDRQTAVAYTGGSLMKRISRLVTVPPQPGYRLGSWLAPLMITILLAGAVSATTFSATEDPIQGSPAKSKASREKESDDTKAAAKKGYYVVDGCLEDVTGLIDKMTAKGMSHDDISEITGMAKTSIKSNLNHARRNIGKMIKKYT